MASASGLVAAVVSAVAEDHHRFAPGLLGQDVLRHRVDGIVEQGSAGRASIRAEAQETEVQSVGRACQAAELLDMGVELDEHGAILLAAEHGLKEDVTGERLVADKGALTAAGVDHEGDGERELGALREVADRHLFPVLLEDEVVLAQAARRFAVLARDDGRDRHDPRCHLERGHGLVRLRLLRCGGRSGLSPARSG